MSNYELPHLEEMNSIPDILQVEFHPWWIRGDLLQWCRDRKVKLVAYSSLGGADHRNADQRIKPFFGDIALENLLTHCPFLGITSLEPNLRSFSSCQGFLGILAVSPRGCLFCHPFYLLVMVVTSSY